MLDEELFDLRLGMQPIAIPGSWVQDDFIGESHDGDYISRTLFG
jgi:hypothetical protein